ncbi:hypothetical protein GCM10025868_46150 [Angustibacter aerolatus]|uniref:Uncharacterized protein n=1 Tax=Angustibacter aerolatus TaxID=1162965 RepID=A0ABQ6JRP9_9ACTN|nr:hypothetical protein GCM10025868_46150 [Angustibacter aerolatus]
MLPSSAGSSADTAADPACCTASRTATSCAFESRTRPVCSASRGLSAATAMIGVVSGTVGGFVSGSCVMTSVIRAFRNRLLSR